MRLISGPADPLPVLAADGIFENSQKQGPLGTELFSPVGAGVKMNVEGIGAQGGVHSRMEHFDISAIAHGLKLGEN